MYYTNYYEFEDYGKWHHPSREMKNYDCDNHFVLLNVKKIYKSYNSTYLHVLNDKKPLLNDGTFKYLDLTEKEIEEIFGQYIWQSR